MCPVRHGKSLARPPSPTRPKSQTAFRPIVSSRRDDWFTSRGASGKGTRGIETLCVPVGPRGERVPFVGRSYHCVPKLLHIVTRITDPQRHSATHKPDAPKAPSSTPRPCPGDGAPEQDQPRIGSATPAKRAQPLQAREENQTSRSGRPPRHLVPLIHLRTLPVPSSPPSIPSPGL